MFIRHAAGKVCDMITFRNDSTDPFYNLAFEEVIFESVREEDIFLLWRNTPSVVVGRYQNICREVQAAALRKQNIPVLRRISGGGTVYHDLGNINYTLILNQTDSPDYDFCLNPVIKALNAIGVPARKNRSCDIAVGEYKISGSAQRIAGGRLLHHGTLLFESDLTVLDHITTQHKNDNFQTKGTLSAICPVTNIRQHLQDDMTIEQFMERLLRQMVPEKTAEWQLTEAQKQKILELRDSKYKSWEWTWGKTPNFTYEKNGFLKGEPIHIIYRASRGILSDVKITCASIDEAAAAERLNGSRLDPEALEKNCAALAEDAGEELLHLMI
ncbi:MAG: biotin/lipoate A/B protein ligase family protein [Anaerovoracaceae bacterium]